MYIRLKYCCCAVASGCQWLLDLPVVTATRLSSILLPKRIIFRAGNTEFCNVGCFSPSLLPLEDFCSEMVVLLWVVLCVCVCVVVVVGRLE